MNTFKSKPVCFNLADPFQKNMYDYCNKLTNYSAYVKRLIQRDLEGGRITTISERKEPPTEIDWGRAERIF